MDTGKTVSKYEILCLYRVIVVYKMDEDYTIDWYNKDCPS